MFREFTRQYKSNCCLHFPRWDGLPLVLMGKSWAFTGNLFEDIMNERVHDTHRFSWNANIGMNLLQYTVDVSFVGFLSSGSSLLYLWPSLSSLSLFSRALLWTCLFRTFWWTWLTRSTHFESISVNHVSRNTKQAITGRAGDSALFIASYRIEISSTSPSFECSNVLTADSDLSTLPHRSFRRIVRKRFEFFDSRRDTTTSYVKRTQLRSGKSN